MASLSPEVAPRLQGRTLALSGGVVALAGAVGLALGLRVDSAQTYAAYLGAYCFAVSVALGALFFLLIGHAAGVTWFIPLRRLSEMIAWSLVPLALLFIPVAVGMQELYPWAAPADFSVRVRALLRHKHVYLNPHAFVLRTALYFAVWLVTIGLLRHWSLCSDRPAGGATADQVGRERVGRSPSPSAVRGFSGGALIPVAFATTFAAFDWLMTLQPEWYSSMFGVYYFAGGFVGGFALLAILAERGRSGPLSDVITPEHFHALGRLLLAFVIFWAYCSYFQALFIFLADKPDEVIFYGARLHGNWALFGLGMVVGQLVVPFALLLARQPKRNPRWVAMVSAWLLLARFAEIHWLVAPLQGAKGALFCFQDAGALAAVLGVCVAFVALTHDGRPLVSLGDPRMADAIAYRGAR